MPHSDTSSSDESEDDPASNSHLPFANALMEVKHLREVSKQPNILDLLHQFSIWKKMYCNHMEVSVLEVVVSQSFFNQTLHLCQGRDDAGDRP